jgi:hypothetical protein
MNFNDAQEFAESVIFRSVTGKLPCSEDDSIDIWDSDRESSSMYELVDSIANSIEKNRNKVLNFELIESPESRNINWGDDNWAVEYNKYWNNYDSLMEIIQAIFGKLVLINQATYDTLILLYNELVDFYATH